MIFLHPLVGAQRDHHRDRGGPIMQRLVRRTHEQGERARSRSVRDHQAHPLALQIGLAELITNKGTDLIRNEVLTNTADERRPVRIPGVRAIAGRRIRHCDHDLTLLQSRCPHKDMRSGRTWQNIQHGARDGYRVGNLPSAAIRRFSCDRYSSSSKSRGTLSGFPAGQIDRIRKSHTIDAFAAGRDQWFAVQDVGRKVLQNRGVLSARCGLELQNLRGVVRIGVLLTLDQSPDSRHIDAFAELALRLPQPSHRCRSALVDYDLAAVAEDLEPIGAHQVVRCSDEDPVAPPP